MNYWNIFLHVNPAYVNGIKTDVWSVFSLGLRPLNMFYPNGKSVQFESKILFFLLR